MKYQHPLKKILSQARPYWDQDEMRASVRRSLARRCSAALQSWVPRSTLRRTRS